MRKSVIALFMACMATSGLAASQSSILAGNWEATSVLSDLTLPPGMPAGAEDMMRDMLGGEGMTSQSCVTQEDLDQAPERMFEETNGDCRYTEFDMAGGEIHAVAQCNTDGGEMTMQMDGTYTATSYDMDMRMQGDAGMGAMTMAFDVTGTRLGDCP